MFNIKRLYIIDKKVDRMTIYFNENADPAKRARNQRAHRRPKWRNRDNLRKESETYSKIKKLRTRLINCENASDEFRSRTPSFAPESGTRNP